MGCDDILTSVACGTANNPNLVDFVADIDTTGLQIWNVVAPAPPAPPTQVLPNGNYYIVSEGRSGTCNSYLSAQNCTTSNAQSLVAAPDTTGLQIWTLTYLPANGTYNIQNSARAACGTYLSGTDCTANLVNLYGIVRFISHALHPTPID